MKKHIAIPFIVSTLIIISTWSCKESIILCPTDQVPYLKCIFSYDEDFYADTFVIAIKDLDSILYASKTPPTSLDIPLQFDKDSTPFQIYYHPDTIDYFTIKYKPNVIFESPDCGFIISFDIDSSSYFTQKKIDSVIILNTIIDKEQYENIEISF